MIETTSSEPLEREGGRWVPSNWLAEVVNAAASAGCGGMGWFVNEDGYGWAWIPNLTQEQYDDLEMRAAVDRALLMEATVCAPRGHHGERDEEGCCADCGSTSVEVERR